MNSTPAPPLTATAASMAGCGGGAANTLPMAAASARPLPTKPRKLGSWPEPPPMTSATLPGRGPWRATTLRGLGRCNLSPWAAMTPSSISSTTSAPALMSFWVRCSLMALRSLMAESRFTGGGFASSERRGAALRDKNDASRTCAPRRLCYLARMEFLALDLARFEAASPAGRRAIGAEVDAICRATGFLNLVGHGVQQATVDALWRAAEAFF